MARRRIKALNLMALACISLCQVASGQPASRWSWPWRDSSALDLDTAQLDILIAGRLVDVQSAEGARAFRPEQGFSGARIYTVQVDEVLKGSISPSQSLPLLILPQVIEAPAVPQNLSKDLRRKYREALEKEGFRFSGDPGDDGGIARTPRQVIDHFEKTGKLPAGLPGRKEVYPELPFNQLLLFSLYSIDLVDPEGEMLWAKGIRQLSARTVLYGYSGSFPVSPGKVELEVARQYLRILQIEPIEAQIDELADYSFELVSQRSPLTVAKGAAANLRRRFSDWSWGSETQTLGSGRSISGPTGRLTGEYLTHGQIEDLVGIADDPSRDPDVRTELMRLFAELHKDAQWNPHKFEPAAFVRILEDESQQAPIREMAVWLLEQIEGQEVEEAFQRILDLEPSTEDQRDLQRRIENSPLMKARRD